MQDRARYGSQGSILLDDLQKEGRGATIVERQVFAVKPGCAPDLEHLIQEIWGWLDSPVPHRLYRPISGTMDIVVQEMGFENFEERQKFMADVFGRPEWSAKRDRWFELADFGTSYEFFTLLE